MANLIFPHRWAQKPPVGVEIDWGHPQALRLGAYWLFNEGGLSSRDLTGFGHAAALANGAVWAATARGIGAQTPAGTQGSVQPSIDCGSAWVTLPATVVWWGDTPSVTGAVEGYMFAHGDAESGNAISEFGLACQGSTGRAQVYYNNAIRLNNASYVMQPGYHCYALSMTDLGALTLYRDGLWWWSLAEIGAGLTLGGPFTLGVYSRTTINDRGQNTNTHLATAVYSRVLSAPEVLMVSNDPYCFLRPIIRRSYAFVGAEAGGGSIVRHMMAYHA